ncbi:hypothetical protein [Streptomyces pristinaespiralis]
MALRRREPGGLRVTAGGTDRPSRVTAVGHGSARGTGEVTVPLR